MRRTLTVNKIAADTDIARIHNDAQVWSVNHLAKVVSGDDPMQAIVDLVGAYWARTDEGLVISCLKGMFGAASMAGNLLAIHSESVAGTTCGDQAERRDLRGRVRQARRCGQQADGSGDALGHGGSAQEAGSDRLPP